MSQPLRLTSGYVLSFILLIPQQMKPLVDCSRVSGAEPLPLRRRRQSDNIRIVQALAVAGHEVRAFVPAIGDADAGAVPGQAVNEKCAVLVSIVCGVHVRATA